ncbi:MAG: aminopeptidase P family protein, partial [Planctomycetota bacterium]
MIPIAESIPDAIVREHNDRLRDEMRKNGIDAVIVFHPSNMLAFTGTPHASWDRLTCAAVTRDAGVHLVCPAFERPGVAGAEPHATIHIWQEDQNPYAVLADALRSAGVAKGRIGVDGRVWLDSWYAFCEALPDARLCNGEALLRTVRIRKSPAEIEILRAAHRRGERLFLELRRLIRPGVSEIELHRRLQEHFDA